MVIRVYRKRTESNSSLGTDLEINKPDPIMSAPPINCESVSSVKTAKAKEGEGASSKVGAGIWMMNQLFTFAGSDHL